MLRCNTDKPESGSPASGPQAEGSAGEGSALPKEDLKGGKDQKVRPDHQYCSKCERMRPKSSFALGGTTCSTCRGAHPNVRDQQPSPACEPPYLQELHLAISAGIARSARNSSSASRSNNTTRPSIETGNTTATAAAVTSKSLAVAVQPSPQVAQQQQSPTAGLPQCISSETSVTPTSQQDTLGSASQQDAGSPEVRPHTQKTKAADSIEVLVLSPAVLDGAACSGVDASLQQDNPVAASLPTPVECQPDQPAAVADHADGPTGPLTHSTGDMDVASAVMPKPDALAGSDGGVEEVRTVVLRDDD